MFRYIRQRPTDHSNGAIRFTNRPTNIMSSLFEKAFYSKPPAYGVAYRYGMLGVCLGLLGWWAVWLAQLSPAYPYDRYGNFVVGMALLLNHLAFSFRWSRRTTLLLRVAACLWIVLSFVYLFYVSPIWFPRLSR
jgi:hypothetical protein